MSYLFAFSYWSWVLLTSILEWFAISSCSGPCLVRTLHYDLPSWVALHEKPHSFIELGKPLHREKAVTHEGVVSHTYVYISSTGSVPEVDP